MPGADKRRFRRFSVIGTLPADLMGIGARMVRRAATKGETTMFRFESVARILFSAVASVAVATVMISAAVPMMPIA